MSDVMRVQNCTTGCLYKTPFPYSVTYVILTLTPAAAQCIVDDDCGDSNEYNGIVKIARCNKTVGLCKCILPMCYDYNSNANQCELKRCHNTYLTDDEKAIGCVNQGSKSKTTALFLNIISFTGATNFYLGNYLLAVGQLLLFITLLATCGLRLCACYLSYSVFCRDKDVKDACKKCFCCCCDEVKNKKGVESAAYATEILLLLLSLAELIWMIHDFIEIAMDGKLDGNGCFLSDDAIGLIQDIAITTLGFGG